MKAAPPTELMGAAQALWSHLGTRKSQLRFRGEAGSFVLRTAFFTTGKRLLALRVVHAKKAELLAREAWALRYLDGAGLAPTLLASSAGTSALPHPHHLLAWPGTAALAAPLSVDDAAALGELLGRFHAEAEVSLRLRAPSVAATSLMATFQALSDDVKAYLARRERDGLPQDLLTLSLSDLMRALRRYVVAAEHHFLPPAARALCHGSLDISNVVVTPEGPLALVGFEHAVAGDPALDLAWLSERADLSEAALLSLVEAWHDVRGRRDPRLIARLSALRVIFRLHRAVASLRELQDLTDLLDDGLGDRSRLLDEQVAAAREHMRLAINGLMDFTGPARPLSLREVEAMGALISVEELHLRGHRPIVGIEGPSYTGKTPLAQDLARRLRVPWLGVAACLRAAAWATGQPAHVGATDLADMLGRMELVVEDSQLKLLWDGQDALHVVRTSETDVRIAPGIVGQPAVTRALAELVGRCAGHGVVVEGEHLDGVLPPGSAWFLVWATPEVRAERREAHLSTLPPPLADARRSQAPDPAHDEPRPPEPRDGRSVLDASRLSLAQQVRAILRAMVPPEVAEPDLSGRPVLFA